MEKKNNDFPYIFLAIAILGLCIICLFNSYKRDKMNKRIEELEQQVEFLQEDNQFLKDHYEEEIVMLDSQLLLLESEIVEMRDGVELIKK